MFKGFQRRVPVPILNDPQKKWMENILIRMELSIFIEYDGFGVFFFFFDVVV